LLNRCSPSPLLRNISWGVLPLVAGLFVPSALIERNNAVETTRVFETKLAAAQTQFEVNPSSPARSGIGA
jgi:hypothetical protein